MPMADRLPQQGTPLCDLPADSASALGLGSGDLCIPYRRIHDGNWGYLWGDSWRGPGQTGEYLGSPVISSQDVFDASGANSIRFTGAVPGGRVRQLFDYAHHADNAADRPDAVWSAEKTQVVHDDTWPASHGGRPRLPALYGGYIHAGSASPSHLTMMISRWNGTRGARPYTVTQWTGLAA
ncbi:hypothetical protein AB0H60_32440 [Nocardia rhamnosiphila]|uniref:hypothetical protein n=1 Tax=Nocardia rhamnosiphila TaxID=426716 RepID=UPI003402F21D